MSVRNGTMTNFAVFGLQGAVLDRPVLDQTGLTDRFDFTLTWAPDESQFGGRIPPPSESPNPPPSLFTAIQEQLGLKLELCRRFGVNIPSFGVGRGIASALAQYGARVVDRHPNFCGHIQKSMR